MKNVSESEHKSTVFGSEYRK